MPWRGAWRLPCIAGIVFVFFPIVHAGTERKPDSKESRVQREMGRKIFAEQCASCHNVNGDKALDAGLPLSERRLLEADMRQNILGRLGEKSTPEQRAAVEAWIRSINKYMKQAETEGSGNAPRK